MIWCVGLTWVFGCLFRCWVLLAVEFLVVWGCCNIVSLRRGSGLCSGGALRVCGLERWVGRLCGWFMW